MQNHLKNQTSPYLLQHAQNPVNWYPWCEEAFVRAKQEDKPIFLSIGYSTCHWCHVMAHESFEDLEVAKLLNQSFISIKVDKEERPDIDSIYMSVCQALTGSGGWPTTIFLTPDQKPFFAGTYFPKTSGYGQIGLLELLSAIKDKWSTEKEDLIQSANEILTYIRAKKEADSIEEGSLEKLIETAFHDYLRSFDKNHGGFGRAPKFPTPHNLLFLLRYYDRTKDSQAIHMTEKTLLQMFRGGLFDHIGGGFCRYATDPYFLVPHFEKMLYDNALLILAYCKAYEVTGKQLYKEISQRTADYILREMTSGEGGFYSAQDADSEGVEGKYYLLEPDEITKLLGEEAGTTFNRFYDITAKGNFEGKNIPNLLHSDITQDVSTLLPVVYEYRKNRYGLHLDDKILTSWNGLMIAAMCHLYRVTGDKTYLTAAVRAQKMIEDKLTKQNTLQVSYRKGRSSGIGFLDDYANEIFALLALHQATLEHSYLEKACAFCKKTMADFYDHERGGFFLYGEENEQLILRPKETYDGAVFSGNSAMTYNLVQLSYLTADNEFRDSAQHQIYFMSTQAKNYPSGHAMFLIALWDYLDTPDRVTIVLKDAKDLLGISCRISLNTMITVLEEPTEEYPLKNGKTTFYFCRGRSCQPPVNEI